MQEEIKASIQESQGQHLNHRSSIKREVWKQMQGNCPTRNMDRFPMIKGLISPDGKGCQLPTVRKKKQSHMQACLKFTNTKNKDKILKLTEKEKYVRSYAKD